MSELRGDPDEEEKVDEASEDRRRAVRYEVEERARYAKRSFEGNGMITDLSMVGIRVDGCTIKVEEGQLVSVSFSLLRSPTPIAIDCLVRRVFDKGFAAEFLDVPPRYRKPLELAVKQLERRSRQENL